MKIAWVTPKWPFPVNDGARQATVQLVKQLSRRGVEIHLCAIVPADDWIGDSRNILHAEKELGVRSVTLIKRQRFEGLHRLRYFFRHPFFPITLTPYRSREVVLQTDRFLSRLDFDLVVFDGMHAAGGWQKNRISDYRTVYRAHNVESEIWYRAAAVTENIFKKMFLKYEAFLVRWFESQLARKSDFVFPVSSSNEEFFEKIGINGTLLTLPIGLSIRPSIEMETKLVGKQKNRQRGLLFVGRLDWSPNQDGLRWFLSRVWPKVCEQARDMTLTIVGSGDREWLNSYGGLPNLRILGQVDDLESCYRDCLATIAPIFFGSGTRVKIIESSLYARACISTQVGVEGIGLIPEQDYYPAESTEKWIETLVGLDSDRTLQVGENARQRVLEKFNPDKIADQFLTAVSA